MKIDGRKIASEIKEKLQEKVKNLRQKNVFPHLAVILIGSDPSSLAYIRQKQKVGEEIGAKCTMYNLQCTIKKNELINLINKLNDDPSIHGIIIQRPVPIDIGKEELDKLIIPKKDVDGFHPKSPFTPPIASAVNKILEWVYRHRYNTNSAFHDWLKKQKILVIGRGETGGKPIAKTFEKMDTPFTAAHSQTKNLSKLCLNSDIIISCVGKSDIVRQQNITNKCIVIGVGLHTENGKLATDYNQEEIAPKAAYYTPVPGGVGPVNVACLFENLLKIG